MNNCLSDDLARKHAGVDLTPTLDERFKGIGFCCRHRVAGWCVVRRILYACTDDGFMERADLSGSPKSSAIQGVILLVNDATFRGFDVVYSFNGGTPSTGSGPGPESGTGQHAAWLDDQMAATCDAAFGQLASRARSASISDTVAPSTVSF